MVGNINDFSKEVLKASSITIVVDLVLMLLLTIYAILFVKPVLDQPV
jgi:hypothetical protein